MRRWLLVQMLVLAALVTAACSTNPPSATPTPTPTLTPAAIATPTSDDVADNAYYRCGGEVGYKLVELTDLIGRTPLTDSNMCPALQGWQDTLEGIRQQHGNCPVPRSGHLLRARDSVDGALERIAEALFYLTQYCGPPRGGEEYWDACLDAVLEAQFHINESSKGFEAFISGDTEALPGAEEPPTRYTVYTNAELRFAGEYPSGWEVEVMPNRDPTTGEPQVGTLVVFRPADPDLQAVIGMQVNVQETAGGIRLSPDELPTDEGYIEFVRDWAGTMPVEIVGEASIIEPDGYRAIQVVTRGTGEDLTYGLMAKAAFLVVEDRVFYIEAGGEAGSEPEILRVYKHFMSTFDVLPLTPTTQPTATARPTDTVTPVAPTLVPATPTLTNIDACPANVACVEVINYCGTSIYFTIAGEMHTVEGNSSQTMQLPPGEYTYTVSLPGYQSINAVIVVVAGATYSLPFTAEVG